jgi:Tol biopolymer transport system component/DNA-binding winged helix-turn-helix (wHTH) protein
MGHDAPSLSPSDPFIIRTEQHEWRVDPDLNRITAASGAATQLEPRVMRLLQTLVLQAGAVVSREALLDAVWKEKVVNEEALTRAVSNLRNAFGDRPQSPAVIDTIHGAGYRFIADVQPAEPEDPETSSTSGKRSGGQAQGVRHLGHVLKSGRESFVGLAVGGVVLLLAVVAGLSTRDAGREAPEGSKAGPSLLETRPFTTYPGRERMPALSSDGSRVAFAWSGKDRGDYDIYLKQTNTADPLRLTEHPADEYFPAWSPDGTTVAFIRATDSTHSLYAVPALGGTPRKLMETQAAFYGIDWSPSGRSIVYADRAAPERPFRLVRLNLSTRDTTVLTSPPATAFGDVFPRWSPSGDTLAFSRRGGTTSHDVYLVDEEGASPRPLTHGELGIRGLDWTPDGRHLVYASNRSGTFGLWKVAVDDASMSRIPTRTERVYHPTIADQTGALIYEDLSYEKDVWEISLGDDPYRATGSRPLLTSTRWDCEAYYSPEGDRLVFTSFRSGAFELWMSTSDGTRPTQLTDFGGPFVENPRWSPDGTRIAFKAAPEGRSAVFVLDVEERTRRRILPAGDGDASASYWVTDWSRDGRWIYAASDRSGTWQLWKVRPDGSEMRQVTRHGAFAAQESVTGDTLFYTKPSRPGLWMRPPGHETGRRVVEDLARADWGNWDITADGLYFVRRTEGSPQVVFRPFDAGAERKVATVPDIASPSLDVSPEGTRLLYARTEQTNSDLMAAREDTPW